MARQHFHNRARRQLRFLGLRRRPAYYGLELAEYQRSGINERDKSWSAQGVDVDGLIEKVAAFDPYVGSMLRLIRAFGLRKREATLTAT